ncbi:MAG: hypothetical protein KAH56_02075 [Candidatus Krumholzibacteria bacterium]|nr:hypothetical protein [Candidatus Krumholzibacteria bacterium]
MNTHLIRRGGLLVAVLLAAALFTACGDSQDAATEQAEAVEETATQTASEVTGTLTADEKEFVARIAAISTAVDKTPAAAETILVQYGLTAEEYEAAVYKIASNPALSEAFEKAKGQ